MEHYIEQEDRNAKILLMDLPKAFGAINRTVIWTTLYKKGLPAEMIKHIRRGHQGTRLAPKYKGMYGTPKGKNVGAFQGSPIRALLFTTYMDDVMDYLASLNRGAQLPTRIKQGRSQELVQEQLWDMVKNEERGAKYNEHQKIRTVKNNTINMPIQNSYARTAAPKQGQREQGEAHRRRQQQEGATKENEGEKFQHENNTYLMTNGAKWTS